MTNLNVPGLADAEGTVTGNTYDKYGSSNPVVKRLMAGFERTLGELWQKAAPRSLLDVGCGEGVLTHKWAQAIDGRVVGMLSSQDLVRFIAQGSGYLQ